MKLPQINWIPFDKNNPPADLIMEEEYLIFLREDHYDNGATWAYHVDHATPYGSYLDDFWDTVNDWDEGQRIEVLAYAEFPIELKESDLVDEKTHTHPDILYLCDRKQCGAVCPNYECNHTMDIDHAVNFTKQKGGPNGDYYEEKNYYE